MNLNYSLYIQYILHATIFILLIGGLGIWFYWAKNNKPIYGYAISPILFLSHALLFSILASFNLISKDAYIIWRDFIFIHALIIFCTTGITLIQITGGKK